MERKTERMVLLKADDRVPYGHVVKAMAEIRRAGIQKVGMVTEPIERGVKIAPMVRWRFYRSCLSS